MIPAHIFEHFGLQVTGCKQVYGGDINQCYQVDTPDARYFLKRNDAAQYPLMFEKEARGLKALANGSSFKIPEVIECGVVGGDQFLLLEWLDAKSPTSNGWERFGESLANMHLLTQTSNAGWQEDNFIGSLKQQNRSFDRWSAFYTECRIWPLVKQLHAAGSIRKQEVGLTEKFCNKLEDVFPDEPMSLLHGDLWSGNKMFVQGEQVAIFDPAVYVGHREMDLGMTRLFGGYDQRFFEAYQVTYPLEKDWEERLPLTQLYPLLVHAILFGGQYTQSAMSIISGFT